MHASPASEKPQPRVRHTHYPWKSEAISSTEDMSFREAEAFTKSGVRLAGKVAGIHWWYKSNHHAAELTSGFV